LFPCAGDAADDGERGLDHPRVIGQHVMGSTNHSTYAARRRRFGLAPGPWAAELKDNGIRVNALSPGVVDTPMLDFRRPRGKKPTWSSTAASAASDVPD